MAGAKPLRVRDWRSIDLPKPIAMVRVGDHTGPAAAFERHFVDAAPKHELGKHHVVRYTAVATSRYREYFEQNAGLDFTRSSDAVEVDVPASERPLAPGVVYERAAARRPRAGEAHAPDARERARARADGRRRRVGLAGRAGQRGGGHPVLRGRRPVPAELGAVGLASPRRLRPAHTACSSRSTSTSPQTTRTVAGRSDD